MTPKPKPAPPEKLSWYRYIFGLYLFDRSEQAKRLKDHLKERNVAAYEFRHANWACIRVSSKEARKLDWHDGVPILPAGQNKFKSMYCYPDSAVNRFLRSLEPVKWRRIGKKPEKRQNTGTTLQPPGSIKDNL